MGISLERFSEGKEPSKNEAVRWNKGRKKIKGSRKRWVPSEDEIKELEYKRKLEGSCFCCIFWGWNFGCKSGDIHTCPIRKIEVAGYMRCRGYFRSR